MKNIKKLILFYLFLTTACRGATSSITVPEDFTGVLPAKEWQVIGPFKYDTLKRQPVEVFNNRDLDAFGISEDDFSESDLVKLKNTKYKSFTIQCNNAPVELFNHTNKVLVKNKGNCYLYTTVYSEAEKEVVFIFDGSRNYRIWINNHKVLEVRDKENAIKNGDRFIRVKLLKGQNRVFAKVNRGINKYSWGLLMAVASIAAAEKIYRENYFTDFVNNPVFGDNLSVYPGPFTNVKLVLKKADGETLNLPVSAKASGNYIFPSKNIPRGLYQSKLILGRDTLSQVVFKGDIFGFVKRLKAEAKDIECDEYARRDIGSSVERINFLLEKLDLSSTEARRYYHRNLLHYSVILKDLLQYTRQHHHNKLFPGVSIKTFAENSGQSMNQFMIHVSSKLVNKKDIPLVLFVPYGLDDSSLTRGWALGNLDQIDMDRKLADDYGFATAWLFIKGADSTIHHVMEHTKGLIERVKRDYRIDVNKVYLVGECVGGKRALLMAETAPDLFSGVAVTSPEIDNSFEGNPLNMLKNLAAIPVCIYHGKNDHAVPVRESEEFVNKARSEGVSVKFLKTEAGHFSLSRDERRYAFVFFDSLRKVSPHRRMTIKR